MLISEEAYSFANIGGSFLGGKAHHIYVGRKSASYHKLTDSCVVHPVHWKEEQFHTIC